ncbi:hypothetical protein [Pontibacter chitinilyticus]|uniref:hypothetical protein n=1 Tax=Pontibacter chitinilyticus TaxID=2674989 RepID=UPI0032198A18
MNISFGKATLISVLLLICAAGIGLSQNSLRNNSGAQTDLLLHANSFKGLYNTIVIYDAVDSAANQDTSRNDQEEALHKLLKEVSLCQ